MDVVSVSLMNSVNLCFTFYSLSTSLSLWQWSSSVLTSLTFGFFEWPSLLEELFQCLQLWWLWLLLDWQKLSFYIALQYNHIYDAITGEKYTIFLFDNTLAYFEGKHLVLAWVSWQLPILSIIMPTVFRPLQIGSSSDQVATAHPWLPVPAECCGHQCNHHVQQCLWCQPDCVEDSSQCVPYCRSYSIPCHHVLSYLLIFTPPEAG